MLHALALAALLLAQDPKAQPKTVEDRLKELDEKISALEKKHKDLADENAVLEKKIADGKAAREKFLRQSASAWVKRYGPSIELSEKQSSEFEELWYGWSKEDLEKPYDAARWKTREEALRGNLTPDQIPRLARKVRDEQEQNARMTLGMFTQTAKLNAEKSAPLEKAVLSKLTIEEGILLAQAHPDKNVSWTQVLTALETSLPEFSSTFTEEEQAALRKVLESWKPRRR